LATHHPVSPAQMLGYNSARDQRCRDARRHAQHLHKSFFGSREPTPIGARLSEQNSSRASAVRLPPASPLLRRLREAPLNHQRKDEGKRLFDRLLALRNDVGLLYEEYDVSSSRLVGNFPQAFSHNRAQYRSVKYAGRAASRQLKTWRLIVSSEPSRARQY
jgi:hypothetical protein